MLEGILISVVQFLIIAVITVEQLSLQGTVFLFTATYRRGWVNTMENGPLASSKCLTRC